VVKPRFWLYYTKTEKNGIHKTGGLVGPGQFTPDIRTPERIEKEPVCPRYDLDVLNKRKKFQTTV
jgi:hypothetical protein